LEDTSLLTESDPVYFNSPSFDCEDEGLKYVAGYVAHCFLKERPDLGEKTTDISAFTKYTSPWISALSRGGLVVPSEEFVAKVYEMEKIFICLHKDNVSLQRNVVKNFHALLLSKFPDLPSALLKKYARTRTFIRIRNLNNRLKVDDAAHATRKRKQLFQFQN
jgi:hypothetical protein